MKLTIAICIYNTDRAYFEECLRSVTESTLDARDYEILVVDDGSTVDYSDIIERFGARYLHTENRGILSARLTAIDAAEGDYIAFVDSDDSVSINYHRPMLDTAVSDHADIVINDWAFHSARARYYCRADSLISDDFDLSDEDILDFFFSRGGHEHSYYVLWNKLFKTSLLRSASKAIRDITGNCDGFSFSEDAMICFFAFKRAQHLKNLHTGFYFYRIHSAQTINAPDEKKLSRQISNMAKTLSIFSEQSADSSHSEYIAEKIADWRALMARTHYSHARAGRLSSLYGVILDAYQQKELSIAKYSDSKAYSNNRLLPTNFSDIDRELYSVWRRDGEIKIAEKSVFSYSQSFIDYAVSQGKKILLAKGGDTLIKPRYNIKNAILMNKIVYRIGLLIFKKGSRARTFLKRFL